MSANALSPDVVCDWKICYRDLFGPHGQDRDVQCPVFAGCILTRVGDEKVKNSVLEVMHLVKYVKSTAKKCIIYKGASLKDTWK